MAGDVMPDDQEQLRKELERYKLVVSELQGKIAALEEDLSTAATMAEVPSVVVTQPELRQTLSRLISKIAMILQAEKVLILLYQPEVGELTVLQPTLGITDEQIAELRITPEVGVSGLVFTNGESAIYNDAISHEQTDKTTVSLLRVRNGVAVPLKIQQRDEEERITGTKIIGVLHVINKRFEQQFNTDDQRLAEMLGDQAAAVISNAQIYIELTEKTEQLEGAFESISAGVIVMADTGEIKLLNPAARKMFSLPEDQMTIGKPIDEIVRSNEILQMFKSALRSGDETNREITGPGDSRIYQCQLSLMGADTEQRSVVAIFYDITELRQIERMKTTFVSTVSHELRTPLTSIKGFITTLMDDKQEIYDLNTRQEFYEIINSECDRLTRLITDLLNVSRIEAGRGIDLHLSEVDVNAIANKLVEQQRAYASEHTITNQLPADLPTIIADADKVTQILENILSNAVRYSPNGGAITITGEDEGETIRVNVTDQGMGIPERHQDMIFQRFHMIADDDHSAVKGTGIGLYLVQHLAQAHGEKSKVWLEKSVEGEGSTFSFRLPKVQKGAAGSE